MRNELSIYRYNDSNTMVDRIKIVNEKIHEVSHVEDTDIRDQVMKIKALQNMSSMRLSKFLDDIIKTYFKCVENLRYKYSCEDLYSDIYKDTSLEMKNGKYVNGMKRNYLRIEMKIYWSVLSVAVKCI